MIRSWIIFKELFDEPRGNFYLYEEVENMFWQFINSLNFFTTPIYTFQRSNAKHNVTQTQACLSALGFSGPLP